MAEICSRALDLHMTNELLEYHFAAPVLRLDTGLKQHYIPIPMEISDALRVAGVRRVFATLNGHMFNRGIQGRKDGERYLMVGRSILKEIEADYGHTVAVSIVPDPEPDTIDLGEEFRAALDQNAEATARFNEFTPGRQRGLAYYVTNAKRIETRVSRALEIVHKLRTRTLWSDIHGDE